MRIVENIRLPVKMFSISMIDTFLIDYYI